MTYLQVTETFPDLPGDVRVGIVWAGTKKHKNDARRSTSLADWAPVLAVPRVSFYSFQVGPRATEVATVKDRVTDLSPYLTDWTVTAAALQRIDLLVSVDTGILHLAGALGVPACACIGAANDFRWGVGSSSTPWYDSVFLVRQHRVNEWGNVFQEVAARLRAVVTYSDAV